MPSDAFPGQQFSWDPNKMKANKSALEAKDREELRTSLQSSLGIMKWEADSKVGLEDFDPTVTEVRTFVDKMVQHFSRLKTETEEGKQSSNPEGARFSLSQKTGLGEKTREEELAGLQKLKTLLAERKPEEGIQGVIKSLR